MNIDNDKIQDMAETLLRTMNPLKEMAISSCECNECNGIKCCIHFWGDTMTIDFIDMDDNKNNFYEMINVFKNDMVLTDTFDKLNDIVHAHISAFQLWQSFI